MDAKNTDFSITSCLCNHATAFTAMYVSPNPLPPLTMARFEQGYAAFVLVSTTLIIFLMALVCARKYDKIDLIKVVRIEIR